jgi:hypothetical protein
MQYLSPSTLLGGSIPIPFDKKAIQLGKKKLLAELELTNGDSIQIGDAILTKGDIIDYFEELRQDHIIDYHLAIEADRVLKDFLEVHNIENGFRYKENSLYHDIGFIEWISPYFLSAFAEAADISFRNTDNGQMSTILDNLLLMTDYDLERAWISITRTLTNNIALLEYYRDNCEKGKFEEETFDTVSHLMSFAYVTVILQLPERRFAEVRNKYAFVMEQVAIYTFNRKEDDRYQAQTWIENAQNLAVAEELKSELANKLVEMRRISDGSKKSNAWNITRFAWLLIFLAAKAFTCNNSYNSSHDIDMSKVPVYIRLNDTTQLFNGDTVRLRLNSPHLLANPSLSRDSYLKHQSDTPARFNYRNLRHSIDSMSTTY